MRVFGGVGDKVELTYLVGDGTASAYCSIVDLTVDDGGQLRAVLDYQLPSEAQGDRPRLSVLPGGQLGTVAQRGAWGIVGARVVGREASTSTPRFVALRDVATRAIRSDIAAQRLTGPEVDGLASAVARAVVEHLEARR